MIGLQNPNGMSQDPQQQYPPIIQTLRLGGDPPSVTPAATRTSRKRKTSPNDEQQTQPQPPQLHQVPVPVHVLQQQPALPHLMHSGAIPPYQYPPPGDYTPGGLPPGGPPGPPQEQQGTGPGGRQLSTSKRAEQNRKAQRAFRERRDQHVKALESRSQLLDAALASADEANRRWEECRTLVDQLRVENAALRAALQSASQILPPGIQPTAPGETVVKTDEPEGDKDNKE